MIVANCPGSSPMLPGTGSTSDAGVIIVRS
jgi:hypothetical protein